MTCTGSTVTGANFLKVIAGDKEGLQGTGSGKVLESGPEDNVFIYFADHPRPPGLDDPFAFRHFRLSARCSGSFQLPPPPWRLPARPASSSRPPPPAADGRRRRGAMATAARAGRGRRGVRPAGGRGGRPGGGAGGRLRGAGPFAAGPAPAPALPRPHARARAAPAPSPSPSAGPAALWPALLGGAGPADATADGNADENLPAATDDAAGSEAAGPSGAAGPAGAEEEGGAGPGLKNGFAKTEEGEALRRERISRANKGKRPWNAGRKHSPETIEKIRQRTRAALMRPEVRQKLKDAATGRSHEKETKEKIKKNRAKTLDAAKRLREAEKAKRAATKAIWLGLLEVDERRLSRYHAARRETEERRARARATRDRKLRAKKSPEHRAKISEAIKAKWGSETYRSRQTSAIRSSARERWQGYEESIRQEAKKSWAKRQALVEKHKSMKEEAAKLLEQATAAAARMKLHDGDSMEARMANELVLKAQASLEAATASLDRLEGNIDEILPSSAKVEQDKGGGGEGRG